MTLAITSGAQAQVLVTDTISNTQTAAISAFQKGAQFAKEVESALNTYNTYMSLLNQAQNLVNNPIGALIPANTNMAHLEATQVAQIIQAKCGSAGGGNIIIGIVSSLANQVNINGNISQSQQQICAGIVTAQVDQYNATADLYNQMPQFHNSLSGLTNLINSIDNIGKSGNSSAQSNTFSNQQKQVIMDWQARTDMDKRIVAALNDQQQVLGQIAMRGNNTILGNVVQAGALKIAFDANK